jgi:replication fork protection complex subunit Csm3/Swi3
MARDARPGGPPPAERDELDEIFNYDTNIDHILDGMDNGDNNSDSNNNYSNASRADGMRSGPAQALGIDEEIKITKQRKPIAKLDETRRVSHHPSRQPQSMEMLTKLANRLTSAAGIPKLQKISKTRLKFKGKGHEVGPYSPSISFRAPCFDN